ncbi:MAG: RnfABCDGE type electron transport complex subunit D [Phycisphaerae bacterium]
MAQDSPNPKQQEEPASQGMLDGAKALVMGERRMLFMKQPQMKRMIYVLTAVMLSGIYFFGWRVLALVLVSCLTCLVVEGITTRSRKAPISMAVFVTAMLFGLSLPATTPYWVAAVGALVGILFGKEVFGGFGRNFANPAIVGRAFVYISFPTYLTARFVPAFQGFPGGFAHWSWRTAGIPGWFSQIPGGPMDVDAVSMASPMWVSKRYGLSTAFQESSTNLWEMFLGNINGWFTTPDGQVVPLTAGSAGEGCTLLIVLAAVYLLWTRTANWRLITGGAIGLAFATVLFRYVLGFDEEKTGVPPLQFTLVAGTTMYALVFMFTDPVSAPRANLAKWAYSFLIGFLVVFLRWRGIFVAAASFSILLGNISAPLIDIWATKYITWRKNRAKAKEPPPGTAAEAKEAA